MDGAGSQGRLSLARWAFARARSFAARHAATLTSIAFLGVMLAGILAHSMWLNRGVFVYGRDDAYIHMSIARNFALHGVWGINPDAFVSASSSPLWTSLLALSYRLFGVGEKAPLMLSIASGVGLLALVGGLLKRVGVAEIEIAATLLLVVFVMPLPYLVLDAMEPALHALVTIGFLYLAAELLSGERSRRDAIGLALLAPLLVAARFEGLFLLALTACLFAIRGRYLYAGLLLILGMLPVAMLGIPSMLHGGWILPNSVMLKGNLPSRTLLGAAAQLAMRVAANLSQSKALCMLALAAFGALIFGFDRQNPWRAQTIRLALFLGTLLMHLAFAQVGNPFRYEAYLIVTGIYVLASGLREAWCEQLLTHARNLWRRSAVATALGLLMVSLPLLGRGVDAMFRAARASHNCFEQQYQMTQFVHRYYPGSTVVLNDIGLVSWASGANVLDLVGLGSTEVARSSARFGGEALGALAHRQGATIAIVYPNWIAHLPSDWIPVGEWDLQDRPFALGGLKIAFFAIDPAQAQPLRSHLEEFNHGLPVEVVAHLDEPVPMTASNH